MHTCMTLEEIILHLDMLSNKNILFTKFLRNYLPIVWLLCKGMRKYDINVAQLTLEFTDNLVPYSMQQTLLGRTSGQ